MISNYLIYLFNLPKSEQIKHVFIGYAIFFILYIILGIYQFLKLNKKS